jgi:hypothetical protein
MNLFIGGDTKEGTQFACCVAASDEGRVKALMEASAELKTEVEFSAPVDLLTLYPHRFDLKVLGLGLTALSRARSPCTVSALRPRSRSSPTTPILKGLPRWRGCFSL